MNSSGESSVSGPILALIGIITVWIVIELVSQGLRLLGPEDPMRGLLDGECVYQVASAGTVIGTRSYPDQINLRDLLKSFEYSPVNNETPDQALPCDTVVNVDQSGKNVSLSRISGSQLIAMGKKVSINESSREDLEAVPGIGLRMAERIINRRSSMGRFNSLRDLEHIHGIGKKKFRELEQYLKL